jgi:hypothetical protein
MELTTAIVLFGIHITMCATVVAIAWYGPLSRQERAKEKVREHKEKK